MSSEPLTSADADHGVASPAPPRLDGRARRVLRALGPGIVTGAADDDPSGIATYSIAGAQLGTALLWTACFTWPLMAAVQATCARIGMVSGRGLMGALEQRFPRRVLGGAAVALFLANTLNVGADLTAMADAAELLTGVTSHLWVLCFAVAISWATIRLRYATIANTLKWLALVLFVYVAAAVELRPDWGDVLHAAVVPHLPRDGRGWATVVAILGTTISPYLFFWQTAEEVEEEKMLGRRTLRARLGATPDELQARRWDIGIGTFFSNVAMFFIILTTALTLHRAGLTELSTSRQVAEALRPLAGRFATLLYALGVVGTGVLAIPTLAGSAAYAIAEVFDWPEGMDERFDGAPAFYTVFAISILLGVGMDFVRVSAVRALYWSAVLNGLLAPVLLAGIVVVASDRTLMANQPSSRLVRLTVALTALLMGGAAVAMFVM